MTNADLAIVRGTGAGHVSLFSPYNCSYAQPIVDSFQR